MRRSGFKFIQQNKKSCFSNERSFSVAQIMKCIAFLVNASIFFTYLCSTVKAEVFTATSDLSQLLVSEKEVIKALDSYLAVEEKKIKSITLLRDQYEKLHFNAMHDEETFLTNPLNAFLLVKRLSEDWAVVDRIIEEASNKALAYNISFQGLAFPDDSDLSGAAAALLRLQDTYLLDTSQLAAGEIAGAKSKSIELTAGDCYQLGSQAFVLEDYKRAIQWMQEALVRWEREEIKTANKGMILEYLAHSSFKVDYVKTAIKLSRQLIETDPGHPRAVGNLMHYESVLNTKGETANSEEEFEEYTSYYTSMKQADDHNKLSPRELRRANEPAYDKYEKLCRGERIQSHRVQSRLKCQYITNNNSYLLLQPVKQEILSLDPFICVYHDVLSDKDLEIFKEISLPMLTRAAVNNPKTGHPELATYRVSKSAWLYDILHPRIEHATQIVKDVTGLETSTAEPLHVINYGIGGHYEPHHDFSKKGEADGLEYLGTGNRIATWIYYLSDVDAGGATVFPNVGVSVKPTKGSAAFWYNLRKNGDGDLDTIHAGCPVLSGNKWIGTKWLHVVGNELRRKCSLDPRD